MVSIRGVVSGSADIRVWEVTDAGDLSQVQQINFRTTGEQIKIDPFGQFMVYPRIDVEPGPVIDMYRIEPDNTISFASSYSRLGWEFANRVNTLTPDGSLYITAERNTASPEQPVYFEAYRISEELELIENDDKFLVGPGGPPGVPFSTTILGSATTESGHLLLHNADFPAFITVYPVSASGEISLPTQQFSYEGAQPINGTWSVSPDQKMAVTGPIIWKPCDWLISFSISPEGTLTEAGHYPCSAEEQVGSDSVFHPSGDSVLTGGGDVVRVGMTSDGEFHVPAIVGVPAPLGSSKPAVSPDGRIAVSLWDVDSGGVHWGVFSLGDDGSITLLQDHILNIGYRDIAFIPPRTEEILGDANGDGRRDIRDVVKLVNHLDGTSDITGPVPLARADATQDGEIDGDDLEWLVDFLLGLNL
jgi:hypothetical protein